MNNSGVHFGQHREFLCLTHEYTSLVYVMNISGVHFGQHRELLCLTHEYTSLVYDTRQGPSLPHGIAQGVALMLDCGWIKGLGRLFLQREKVGFIENTAMRHRWGG